jgi:hypothetical protein
MNRVVPARQATQPGRIGSLESILGLLNSLKIQFWRAGTSNRVVVPACQAAAMGIDSWSP